jgi:hypothetical protein
MSKSHSGGADIESDSDPDSDSDSASIPYPVRPFVILCVHSGPAFEFPWGLS